jgi:hypothetical protein
MQGSAVSVLTCDYIIAAGASDVAQRIACDGTASRHSHYVSVPRLLSDGVCASRHSRRNHVTGSACAARHAGIAAVVRRAAQAIHAAVVLQCSCEGLIETS